MTFPRLGDTSSSVRTLWMNASVAFFACRLRQVHQRSQMMKPTPSQMSAQPMVKRGSRVVRMVMRLSSMSLVPLVGLVQNPDHEAERADQGSYDACEDERCYESVVHVSYLQIGRASCRERVVQYV